MMAPRHAGVCASRASGIVSGVPAVSGLTPDFASARSNNRRSFERIRQSACQKASTCPRPKWSIAVPRIDFPDRRPTGAALSDGLPASPPHGRC